MPNRRKLRNKRKHKKGKRGNSSGSSTPQSSTPSVEDERQQLLQSGASGSSESRDSRATKKTKDAGRTGSGESSTRNTGETSKNASQSDHSSKMDLLAVPDQGSGACGPRSPSRNPLSLLKNVLTPKKKSPNRSSDFECICADKKKHQPECPKLKNLPACAKGEGLKGESTEASANESKPSSSDASPIVSKKNKDGTHSSSSSDPSAAEYFKNSSEQALEESLPTVQDQGKGACGESSPSKKNPLTMLKNVFKHKRSSPNRSPDTKRSFENTKPETGARSKKPGRTKSEASSSGSSSISRKNKDGNSSNVSSENSRHSSSKSYSHSDPSVELSSGKSSHSSDCRKNSRDYDPQEGTSRGPARCEGKREQHHGSSASEDISKDKEQDLIRPIPRRRSKSNSFAPLCRSRKSSGEKFNFRSLSIQLRHIEWAWLEQMRRPMHPNFRRTARINDPDENERRLLRRIESVRPVPAISRQASLSPIRVRDCNCGAGNEGIDHSISCSRQIDARRRRNLRKCRQSPRRF